MAASITPTSPHWPKWRFEHENVLSGVPVFRSMLYDMDTGKAKYKCFPTTIVLSSDFVNATPYILKSVIKSHLQDFENNHK